MNTSSSFITAISKHIISTGSHTIFSACIIHNIATVVDIACFLCSDSSNILFCVLINKHEVINCINIACNLIPFIGYEHIYVRYGIRGCVIRKRGCSTVHLEFAFTANIKNNNTIESIRYYYTGRFCSSSCRMSYCTIIID